ncbi:MAG: DUF3017 domain-containing protein, partial [Frankia sp.]|nr:DUF3017 domain-containing protein [Frankia sp.]
GPDRGASTRRSGQALVPDARTANQLPIAAVLGVGLCGLTAVGFGYWRKGSSIIGLACLLGAVLRLVLPTRRAGLLAVRGRLADVIVLGTLGVLVLALAVIVPIQR